MAKWQTLLNRDFGHLRPIATASLMGFPGFSTTLMMLGFLAHAPCHFWLGCYWRSPKRLPAEKFRREPWIASIPGVRAVWDGEVARSPPGNSNGFYYLYTKTYRRICILWNLEPRRYRSILPSLYFFHFMPR